MKRLLSILLVMTLLSQGTSKLWIMCAFYAQKDYIANNLCEKRFEQITMCQGSCYLDQKLEENDEREQNIPNLTDKEAQFICLEITTISIDINFLTVEKHLHHGKSAHLVAGCIHSVFHPPKA